MAILKVKQIREMKKEEAQKKLSELKLEFLKEQANVNMGRPIKNPGKIGELRRAIARILTIQRQTIQRQTQKESGAKK